ncbi:DUF4097 family beta strand repeat-containing protein [Planctomycetaceae bacterium SH139]
MQRCFSSALVCSLLLLPLGCGTISFGPQFSAQQTERFVAPVPTGQLIVEGRNGSIKLRSGAVEELQFEAVIEVKGSTQEEAQANLDQISIEQREEDGNLVVSVEGLRQVSGSVSFVIVVPKATPVQLGTSNGGIEVTDLQANMRLRSSNGKIVVQRAEGDVNVETSNGAIDVESVVPITVWASTSNGSVTFKGGLVGDDNRLESSNGSLKLTLWGPQTKLSAKTSNGQVTINGEKQGKSVTTTVGEGDLMPAAINLKTSNGKIIIETIEDQAEPR